MKIAIIGGGASGMMASARAKELCPSCEVYLIERNPGLGSKVLLTGGGRCNLTTGFSDLRLIAERYPRGGKFILSALHAFPPESIINWFEGHGITLKVEEDLRVFPASNNGQDIVKVFEELFKENGTKVLLKHQVDKIEKFKKGFKIFFHEETPLIVDKLILTTGGQAYRTTGSNGDGYAFAETLGHSITKLAPSLNSFVVKELWPKTLAGLSLKKVHFKAKRDTTWQFTGPMLFTHHGLTGPAIFAMSSMVAFEEYSPKNPLELVLDFLPDTAQNIIETEIKKEMDVSPQKFFRNTLSTFAPKSLAEALCKNLEIPEEKRNADLAKNDFFKIVEALKHTKLTIIGRGPSDEFVTAGGIDTDEVNQKTMESKICSGLYFAGELLNIDGFTGGFNLTSAWATGRIAGENAVI
ncbi:MAG: aminoacetone oxidase family FAD-binding enzyme [Candidatus Gracilibacteria bacterium]